MLQRYDISMDEKVNRLSIEEFAILGQISRKREHFEPSNEKYLSTYKVSYDADNIRIAIDKGKEALISELRSDDFFPIRPCVEMLAESVIELFKDHSDPFFEMFFDDRTLFVKHDA